MRRIVIVWMICWLSVTLLWSEGQGRAGKGKTVTVSTVQGKTITVAKEPNGLRFHGYENRIVLLEAFGYRCPPCLASIPGYNRLRDRFGDKIEIVAVEAWGMSEADLRGLVKQRGMRYDVVATAKGKVLLRWMGSFSGWNLNYGVPYLQIYAKGGKLAYDLPPGGLDETKVQGLIETLLRSPAKRP